MAVCGPTKLSAALRCFLNDAEAAVKILHSLIESHLPPLLWVPSKLLLTRIAFWFRIICVRCDETRAVHALHLNCHDSSSFGRHTGFTHTPASRMRETEYLGANLHARRHCRCERYGKDELPLCRRGSRLSNSVKRRPRILFNLFIVP